MVAARWIDRHQAWDWITAIEERETYNENSSLWTRSLPLGLLLLAIGGAAGTLVGWIWETEVGIPAGIAFGALGGFVLGIFLAGFREGVQSRVRKSVDVKSGGEFDEPLGMTASPGRRSTIQTSVRWPTTSIPGMLILLSTVTHLNPLTFICGQGKRAFSGATRSHPRFRVRHAQLWPALVMPLSDAIPKSTHQRSLQGDWCPMSASIYLMTRLQFKCHTVWRAIPSFAGISSSFGIGKSSRSAWLSDAAA